MEIAGPGFLNLFLSDAWYLDALGHVISAGADYGAGGAAPFEKVNVEFVSANPTGPLHVGHARNAAYGDGLARLFSFVGHDVTREFYINDFGSQVANFGRSVQARARGEEVPEDGYVGDYVATLALELDDAATRPVEEVGLEAVALMVERAKASLHAFGVEFDVWFSEKSLHERDAEGVSGVTHGFDVLAEQGHSYTRRRRAVAEDDRLRRRQGPRDRAVDRRAHVLRVGHRLRAEQARARLRPHGVRVGRRPPRLHRADARRVRGAGRGPGPASTC